MRNAVVKLVVDLKLSIFLIMSVVFVVLVAYAISDGNARHPHTVVRLGSPVSIVALQRSGGGSFSFRSSGPSDFYRKWLTVSRGCGLPRSPRFYQRKRRRYVQYFRRCYMTQGPVSVHRYRAVRPVAMPSRAATAQPLPSPTPLPRAAGPPAPSYALPTATPFPVYQFPPTPRPVQSPPSDPVQYELYLMNQSRATSGLPPFTLNDTQSRGTSSCVGSYGHAQHMANVGMISHDQFGYAPAGDICFQVAAGENVGMAGGYSVTGALDVINNEMMAEPIGPGIQNHHTSIISTSFHEVGIGVATTGSSTYVCVDFLG